MSERVTERGREKKKRKRLGLGVNFNQVALFLLDFQVLSLLVANAERISTANVSVAEIPRGSIHRRTN